MTQKIRNQVTRLGRDQKQSKRNHSACQGMVINALIGSIFPLVFLAQNADARDRAFCNHMLPCGQEIAQQPFGVTTPNPGEKSSVGVTRIEETSNSMIIPQVKGDLLETIKSQREMAAKLRQTNHAWNIAFAATGVSMTLLATALGAVGSASEKAKARTTITIAVIGAVAAAAQTIASKFPVAKRAGEYAQIETALAALEFRLTNATKRSELNLIQSKFEEQMTKMGKAEAAD